MPAPAKNQNALKPPEERLDGSLHIRCTSEEHAAWAGASALAGAASLSAWAVGLLNAASAVPPAYTRICCPECWSKRNGEIDTDTGKCDTCGFRTTPFRPRAKTEKPSPPLG
jgi:hypothetical protein